MKTQRADGVHTPALPAPRPPIPASVHTPPLPTPGPPIPASIHTPALPTPGPQIPASRPGDNKPWYLSTSRIRTHTHRLRYLLQQLS